MKFCFREDVFLVLLYLTETADKPFDVNMPKLSGIQFYVKVNEIKTYD